MTHPALEAAAQWAARPGPPNWVFVVALLTTAYRWSNFVVGTLRRRFGTTEDTA